MHMTRVTTRLDDYQKLKCKGGYAKAVPPGNCGYIFFIVYLSICVSHDSNFGVVLGF